MSPKPHRAQILLRCIMAGALIMPLAGCDLVVLNPAGDIARQEAWLLELATALMLLIIVPVMALTVLFAWRYRASNTSATFDPDWHHSTKLELVIWSAPLAIIVALGSVTWTGTHLLDPYRALDRIDDRRALPAGARPLDVEVVALDWKWLFIYPEQHVATVNQLVLPVDRPVRFRITADNVMNSFYVPALAGQIYAMPGMETKLHAVLNRTGDFAGLSANFSGAGFAHMHFVTRGLAPAAFGQWVATVQHAGGALDHAGYLTLARPSQADPVRSFATVAPDLFDAVLNRCVAPGQMCAGSMMMADAKGGTGRAGLFNVASATAAGSGRFVRAWCADNRPRPAPAHEVAAAPMRRIALNTPVPASKEFAR